VLYPLLCCRKNIINIKMAAKLNNYGRNWCCCCIYYCAAGKSISIKIKMAAKKGLWYEKVL